MNTTMDEVSKKTKLGIAGVFVAAVAALSFFVPLDDILGSLLEWAQGLGATGAIVLGAAYVLAAILFAPGSLLTMGAGFVYGLVWGAVIVTIAANLAAAISFVIGRFLARDWVASKVSEHPRFAALDEAVGDEGFKIVLLSRLSPVFPFGLMNYGYGVTRVSFWTYVAGTVIGMIPGTLMYVYFGTAAENLAELLAGEAPMSTPQMIFFGAGLVATVGVVWVVTRAAKSKLESITQHSGNADTHPGDSGGSPGNAPPEMEPQDSHNAELIERVHPRNWTNPSAEEPYNLVVIGGGTAGLVSAAGAAGLGGRVALVERDFLGGDCLNFGCVPSKALLATARVLHDARNAKKYGVVVDGEIRADFPAIMRRMRRLRATIGAHDSAERFTDLGVDVYFGEATFIDDKHVQVDGQTLKFTRCIVATGARAFVPPIDGIEEVDYCTNETLFELTELPRRFAVIGGGAIGCEMAQAFARFGSEVHVVEMLDHLISHEDPDAIEILEGQFQSEGIDLHLGTRVVSIRQEEDVKILTCEANGESYEIEADEVLVATGRVPNVDGLGLDEAGIEHDRDGIEVDDHLQTTNSRVYAAGDVCFEQKFTHTADALARIAVQNALFFGRKSTNDLVIPRCTYTDPAVAHIGMLEPEARERNLAVATFGETFDDLDRAIVDGETNGFIKVHTWDGSGDIIGATIVSRHAGDLISELSLAMTADVGLGTIASTIHPYPTQSESIKHAADQYNRERLKEWMSSALERWFSWRR